MISAAGCAMALRNSAVVSTTTVAPPAPPEVPFWPQAFTLAKPSAWPGCGGVGVPVGVGEGEDDMEGVGEGDWGGV